MGKHTRKRTSPLPIQKSNPMTKRFPNKVALTDDSKAQLIDTLNAVLATGVDLQIQVKQAGWNIKGPQFFARHLLFDKVAERLRSFADDIAERAATLGGGAKGTVRLSGASSKIPEYDLKAVDGTDQIKALVDRFATYTKLLRRGIEEADTQRDPVTADLYAGALRNAELDMWFLDGQLQA
ncbi:MAG: starvation-inducible DNA-binding protein [Polyangiales bacterium]|jgi:starvation-inducible DNA-binding protein